MGTTITYFLQAYIFWKGSLWSEIKLFRCKFLISLLWRNGGISKVDATAFRHSSPRFQLPFQIRGKDRSVSLWEGLRQNEELNKLNVISQFGPENLSKYVFIQCMLLVQFLNFSCIYIKELVISKFYQNELTLSVNILLFHHPFTNVIKCQ